VHAMVSRPAATFPVCRGSCPHRLWSESSLDVSLFGSLPLSFRKPAPSRRSSLDVGAPPKLLLFEHQKMDKAADGSGGHRVNISSAAIPFMGGLLFARRHQLSTHPRWRQPKVLCRNTTRAAVPAGTVCEDISSGGLHLDVVQFGASIYYVSENEGSLNVEITRVGNLKEACTVNYSTESGSAADGKVFSGRAGKLTFLPGEELKTIQVPIIDDEDWNATLEFSIRLFEAEGCLLSKAMSKARVKVIDNDVFPTNRMKNDLQDNESYERTSLDLFVEYCKMNLVSANVAEKSVQCLLIDQGPNLYFLLNTYLLQYVADDVLVGKKDDLLCPGDVNATLFVVAALYVVPLGGLYLLERYRNELAIEEASRTLLQENVFRKYLDITDASRGEISSSGLSMIFSQDIEEVVSSGLMKIFDVAANLGRIVVVSYFILSENPAAIVPIVVYMVLIPVAFARSYSKSARLNKEASEEGASMIETVQEGSVKYRVIADYFMRPLIQETFRTKVAKQNVAKKAVLIDNVDRRYISPVLGSVLLGVYMFYGSEQVLGGTLSIGTFVATVNVFQGVADIFKDLYSNVLDLSKALGPLQKISAIMNMPSYSDKTRQTEKWRLQETSKLRECSDFARIARQVGARYRMDAIDIRLSELEFRYGGGPPVLENVNLSIPQGSFVAIVGPSNGGKSTFMRLLGQVVTPTKGNVFISSHLRVLHVAQHPLILKGGVWRNVALNHQFGDLEAEQRAMIICRKLGFSDYLLEHMDHEKRSGKRVQEQGSEWQARLSTTDQVLISLARAFIYNAEVLVLHRPTSMLSINSAKRVYALLHENVENRGVGMPASTVKLRRPRTVFVSCVRDFALESIGTLICVSNGNVQRISHKEVTTEMLD